jgi:predicted nuclease of predicted toxin-antitoxin system
MMRSTFATSECRPLPMRRSSPAPSAENRVLVSADTDFGGLLARSGAASPSVLLIRRLAGRRAAEQSVIIRATLDQVAEDLSTGAIVVLSDEWVRIRPLPL